MAKKTGLFLTTRWTLLEKSESPDSGEVEDELCRRYWHPVHKYFLRFGAATDEAADLTQDFFVSFLGNGGFSRADRSKGRFRSFLLAAVKNHYLNDRKSAGRLKRGGHLDFVPVNEDLDRATGLTPDEAFEKAWAEDLLSSAARKVRDEWEAKGRPFGRLSPYLTDGRQAPKLQDTARDLEISLAALKSAVVRLRRRFLEVVREEVRSTVTDPAEEEAELRHLITILST